MTSFHIGERKCSIRYSKQLAGLQKLLAPVIVSLNDRSSLKENCKPEFKFISLLDQPRAQSYFRQYFQYDPLEIALFV